MVDFYGLPPEPSVLIVALILGLLGLRLRVLKIDQRILSLFLLLDLLS